MGKEMVGEEPKSYKKISGNVLLLKLLTACASLQNLSKKSLLRIIINKA